MATVPRSLSWQRSLVILSSVTVGVVATAALYWAQKVLIPVALAVFIAFLLSPLVSRLQHRGLGRMTAVFTVVGMAALLVGGLGWLISSQIQGLAGSMPQYTANIKDRIRGVRDLGGKDSIFEQLHTMAKELGAVWNEPAGEAEAPGPPEALPAADHKKIPVKVEVDPGPSWINNILPTVPWLLEIAGSGALALVLAVFMLLKREDLRNRVIWLTGGGSRVALTTKALDDIGHRISRYLLAQLGINASYGVAMATGLALIGVEHWLLWGFLAGLLRYLPYIGAPAAAVFPITLSLAQFEGWTQPLLVIGWIVFLELLASNVLEPWLFGKSIGVSEVALLVAAGFWVFLWGPVGLVLSGPLTVCLLVVGEYVPALRFLAVMLGDEPALDPDITLFQRLTAGDQDEAMAIVTSYIKKHSAEQVYDGLLLPALAHVRTALALDDIGETDERYIIDTMRWILDDLGGEQHAAPATPGADNAEPSAEARGEAEVRSKAEAFQPVRKRVRIVGCAARDELDQLSLEMLKQALDPSRWDVEVVPVTLLAGELISFIEEKQPAAICIGSLPPGGLAHARYLCKRLRGRFPELKILVGRWAAASASGNEPDALRDAGADKIDVMLVEARDQLTAWLPVLQQQTTASTPLNTLAVHTTPEKA